MRDIESKKDIEKRRKKNQFVVGGILILVMLGSTFGYAFYQLGNKTDVTKTTYNGYKFTSQNDFWTTTVGSYQFVFRYNPNQVERINSTLSYLDSYSGVPVYISSQNSAAEVEIDRNLGNVVLRFQGACLTEKNCPENWPIKDCSNKFIIIREANESNVYQNQSCVFIEGKEENLTELTDEFLFKILSIDN